jgi:hypothetical protein
MTVSNTNALIAVEDNNIQVIRLHHGGNILNTGVALIKGYSEWDCVQSLLQAKEIKLLRLKSIDATASTDWPVTLKDRNALLDIAREHGYAHVYLFDKVNSCWLYFVQAKSAFMRLESLL